MGGRITDLMSGDSTDLACKKLVSVQKKMIEMKQYAVFITGIIKGTVMEFFFVLRDYIEENSIMNNSTVMDS